jgi:hypothetical protein
MPPALPSPSPSADPLLVSTEQIDKEPTRYDGKRVTLTAYVRNLREATSKSGKEYDVMRLCEERCIRGFTEGRPKIANGSRVTVTGVYRTIVHADKNTWINEVTIETLNVVKPK